MGYDSSEKNPSMSLKNAFSSNLSQRVNQSGKSQASIAEELGISASALSGYCNGAKYPRPEVLRRLADYFNTSVGELTDDETTWARQSRLSQEATGLASRYDRLDDYGKRLVRLVLDAELRRCEDSRNGLKD